MSESVTPLVSVCIQTYQHGKYIRQCLESVFAQQTNFPFEVIIGEDESTDGTREICQEFKQRYPDQIHLFLNSRSQVIYIEGSATGRFNFLQNLRAARGKYIALLEGDDYWCDPMKLQKQVEVLEKEEDVTICFHECKRVYDDSFEKSEDLLTASILKEPLREYYSIEDLIEHEWFMGTASVMFRNRIPKEWPEFMMQSISGDIPMYYIILRAGGRIKMLPDIMAVYHKHRAGITANLNYVDQVYRNRIRMYGAIDEFYEHRYQTAFKKRIAFFENKITAALRPPGLLVRLKNKLKQLFSL